MAKEKKKSLGIKTTRYFTKTCGQCKFEYPNWFTSCPKCGATWNSSIEKITDQEEILKKTIKIVVKITKEDFNESINYVHLIFSANQGKSWYQMIMENKQDYFLAEISDVPTNITLIYYIQVHLVNGEEVIENNDGKYFYYKVGAPIGSLEETDYIQQQEDIKDVQDYEYKEKEVPPKDSESSIEELNVFKQQDSLISQNSSTASQISISKPEIPPPRNPIKYESEKHITIFGRQQTEIDPDLKICPYCNSKIKKMWSTCPICGKDI